LLPCAAGSGRLFLLLGTTAMASAASVTALSDGL
jgi:hypothetical protein